MAKRNQRSLQQIRLAREELELSKLQRREASRLLRFFADFRIFIQTGIAVLIGMPILVFYLKDIIGPTYERENIKISLELEKEKRSLHEQRLKFEQEKKDLQNEVRSWTDRYLSAQRANATIAEKARYYDSLRHSLAEQSARWQSRKVTASVIDENDSALSGVEIFRQERQNDRNGMNIRAIAATSDQNGEFVLYGEEGETSLHLQISKSGFDDAFVDISVPSSDKRIRLKRSRPYSFWRE